LIYDVSHNTPISPVDFSLVITVRRHNSGVRVHGVDTMYGLTVLNWANRITGVYFFLATINTIFLYECISCTCCTQTSRICAIFTVGSANYACICIIRAVLSSIANNVIFASSAIVKLVNANALISDYCFICIAACSAVTSIVCAGSAIGTTSLADAVVIDVVSIAAINIIHAYTIGLS
jgi:hypothetical protein